MQDHESELPSQLQETIQTVMNYSESPQPGLSPEFESLKSDLEQGIDLYEQAQSANENHYHISRSSIIGIAISVIVVSAAFGSFYLTQYSVTRLKLANDNCQPLQFEDSQQPFKLVRIPSSPISTGGYAMAQIPAGMLTIDSLSPGKLRLEYTFGLSLFLELPENVSEIELNNSQSIQGSEIKMDVPKDAINSIRIKCL